MLDDVDDKLTRTQSRSAWIAGAIAMRLEQRAMEIPTNQLMAMLHARIDDETLKTLLVDRLKSW